MDGYALVATDTMGASRETQKSLQIIYFLRVKVERKRGEYFARLTDEQGSGILSSMVKADGLAIIPEERKHLEAGERVKVMMLDWPEERTR